MDCRRLRHKRVVLKGRCRVVDEITITHDLGSPIPHRVFLIGCVTHGINKGGDVFLQFINTGGHATDADSATAGYDDIVGVGTPLDNVKHLYGAIRLISRSLTDTNPALALLETFCLAYLGTKKNKSLESQLTLKYSEAFIDSYKRATDYGDFWKSFKDYNTFIKIYLKSEELETLSKETRLLIHSINLSDITKKYIDDNE